MEGHSEAEKREENKLESGRTGEEHGGGAGVEDAVMVGVEGDIKDEGGLRMSRGNRKATEGVNGVREEAGAHRSRH